MLEEVLATEGLTWADLDGVAVGTGPGNFTGIRIAVSAARGLALGLGKPTIGVNGFEARAEGHVGPLRTLIAAPRGQCYCADMDADGILAAPVLTTVAEVEAEHSDLPVVAEKSAADLIAAVARIAAGRLGRAQPRPSPLYVRGADAAPARDAPPVILP
jgi:tRNA threonylcarbamoyl adenosine modification protein YeaZ